MLLTMNTYVSLLWGISVLFFTGTESTTIPETTTTSSSSSSSSRSTADLNKATTQLYTSHVLYNGTETPTHKPAEMSRDATAVTLAAETRETGVSSTTAVAAAASSSSRHILTSGGQATPSRDTVSSQSAKPTEGQPSPAASARGTSASAVTASTPSAASSPTAAVSSPRPTSTTEPEVTPASPSTTSSDHLTRAPGLIQSLGTTSASTMTTNTTHQTSEAAALGDPTSFPVTKSETAAATSAEPSSTSRPISVAQTLTSTSRLPGTAGSSSTSDSPTSPQRTSTDSAVSTGPAGGRPVPKLLPVSAATTAAAPPETTTRNQPCSNRGVVARSLIAIASLAGLATVFMVSTIILCAKLSARKYKVKNPQQGTEMICISSLLPERNYSYRRQRNPVSNGVLVIPTCGDSDDDAEDNLTLSSFLPENERTV